MPKGGGFSGTQVRGKGMSKECAGLIKDKIRRCVGREDHCQGAPVFCTVYHLFGRSFPYAFYRYEKKCVILPGEYEIVAGIN